MIENVSEFEKKLILEEFNDTYTDYPREKTVVELFEEQVTKTPEHIAVIFEEEALTYKALNMRANALAHKLRALGIGPDDYIALVTERSIEMIVGIYGIIKAGGAYVPIEPTYPSERIQYMLEDCQPKAVLTYQSEVETNLPILDLGEVGEGVCENPVHVNQASDLIYCIYTSGTTGKPKGVMIEHKGLVNLINWLQSEYPITEADTILQKTTYVFDVSMSEIFWWSTVGARLAILQPEMEKDPIRIVEAIEEYQISVINFAPSMLSMFTLYMAELNVADQKIKSLKYVLAAGEALTATNVNSFYSVIEKQGIKVKLGNIYGPTEASVYASYYHCEKGMTSVPIGRPISNTQVYMMNGDMLCGVGVPGELCIAGDGLARGYLNQPELTAEKFVPNPYGEGKLYLSGDLARWLLDGNIEYLGRIDDQVKIRGFRIELGEIEHAIQEIKEVKDCVVIARVDGNGEQAIYGYVVSDTEVSMSMIRENLAKRLPDYMIPAYLMQIESIPLTRNGKLDKRALPEIEARTETMYVSPRNRKEEVVCLIFKEILELDTSVGIDDHFFDLGGDSIKAIRILSKLRKRGYQTDVRSIVQNKTPRKIGAIIQKSKEVLINQGELVGEVALTPIQKDFILKNNKQVYHFNYSIMLESQARIGKNLLRKVLNELVRHHDMLRVTYQGAIQKIKPYQENKGFDLYEYDYRDIANEGHLAKEIDRVSKEIQRSMTLETGSLFKVSLFQAQTKDYLLLCNHPLIMDMISWRVLIEDFTTSYQLLENGKHMLLPQKTSSFGAWSEALVAYQKSDYLKKEIPYWKEVEQNVEYGNIVLNSSERPAEIEVLSTVLSKKQTSPFLYKAPQVYQTELSVLLLTSVVRGIAKVTGQKVVSIHMVGHKRAEIDEDVITNQTVGCFTTMYPVVIKSMNERIEHNLNHVKEILRQIPNHGIGYGVLKSLDGKVLEGVTPTVTFNDLGEFVSSNEKERFTMCEIKSSYSDDWHSTLHINMMVLEQRLKIEFLYNVSKISRSLAQNIKDQLIQELEIIVQSLESKNEAPDDIQKMISGDLSFIETSNLGEIETEYEPSTFQQYYLNDKQIKIISHQFQLEGDFEKEEVIEAVTKVIEKNETLRSSYQKQNGQYVLREHFFSNEMVIPYLDIRYTSQSTRATIFKEVDHLEKWQKCFIEKACLSQFLILREADKKYRVVFKAHHAVWDAMSSVLLEEKVRSYLKGGSIKSSTPYSHYVKSLNSKIDRQCRKIKTDFIDALDDYHQIMKNNPMLRLETAIIKLPEHLHHLNEHDHIWDVLLYISGIIAEANGLLGSKIRKIPMQILQESRSKLNLDCSKSLGLFIDLAPLLIHLDQIKAGASLSSYIHDLDVLKRKNNISWLDLIGNHAHQLDSVLFVNYLGLYDIHFDTLKKLMVDHPWGGIGEITIALYGHHLIVKYPIFRKSTNQISELLQEKMNMYER